MHKFPFLSEDCETNVIPYTNFHSRAPKKCRKCLFHDVGIKENAGKVKKDKFLFLNTILAKKRRQTIKGDV